MENKLDINKISADVITDLAKTTAQTAVSYTHLTLPTNSRV